MHYIIQHYSNLYILQSRALLQIPGSPNIYIYIYIYVLFVCFRKKKTLITYKFSFSPGLGLLGVKPTSKVTLNAATDNNGYLFLYLCKNKFKSFNHVTGFSDLDDLWVTKINAP